MPPPVATAPPSPGLAPSGPDPCAAAPAPASASAKPKIWSLAETATSPAATRRPEPSGEHRPRGPRQRRPDRSAPRQAPLRTNRPFPGPPPGPRPHPLSLLGSARHTCWDFLEPRATAAAAAAFAWPAEPEGGTGDCGAQDSEGGESGVAPGQVLASKQALLRRARASRGPGRRAL